MIKKFTISFILVITLLFSFTIFAFADPIGGAGLLNGALSSLGIDLLTGGSATIATLVPWLNSNYSLIGTLTGVADGYIKIGDSSVFIDGVEFESVFLDPNMAQSLHTQAFDFKTQFGIVSNSSGIIATGYGYLTGGVPLYNVNGTLQSQVYNFSYPGGDNGTWSIVKTGESSTQWWGKYYWIWGESYISSIGNTNLDVSIPSKATIVDSNKVRIDELLPNGTVKRTINTYNNIQGTAITQSPFDFTYVSGNIDVDPLPSDYGFQVFVPVDDLEDAGFNPGTYILDVGTGTDDIIQLIQLLDEIFVDENILNPEFTDVVDPPSPTPTPIPIPTDALGSVPYPDFLDTFGQSVYDRLDNIEDTVDTVGQSIADELEYQSTIFDTIGLAIDSIEEAITDVVDGIQVKVGEIADTLVDIKDGILEAIEEGPIKLIDSGLDVLRSVFGSILQTIRSHVGIWHYVVSWVQSISTPFTWILSIANGTSYYMVLPLYALVAGTLVIAIYKRFGR